jgi:hypothetical protein
MKHMTYEQAREYIAGPQPFDSAQHEVEHVEMLVKSVKQWLEEYEYPTGTRKNNLLHTVNHYIEIHENAPNVCKLKQLVKDIESHAETSPAA